ncbi:Uncharacterised protein [Porphyromonas crevioricanis]|uniref:Uncharacterized protein n=1 Tax=Porphyromonas crevioricanis TaxID=393921 RepID=A0A2X4PNK2_9PORP|nr:hypothetical protein [Porphyromonas crevioricanis]SQH73098.1 Uncharacterised protein [Porphyromonas crevioricanis]
MKAILFVTLFTLIIACGHAQVKTKNQKEMEQEKAKMEVLIKERLQKVKTYAEKPAYYLQVNKTGCRLLIRVNDIPLGYHFVKDRGQSMLYPINDVLLGSGRHTVSIEVYPRTGETLVAKDAVVNIKVVHYREKLVGMPETIEELYTPEDIGTLKTPLYRDTLSFDASLPFDFKHILAQAKDLRKVPHLEEKVLAHYNKVRQMMIDGQYYEYEKMRLPTTWPLTEMSYLGEEGLRKAHIDEDYLFRFLCNPIDWIALPIENYEMVICGNGKLVYLRRKMELDNVLRTEYYETEEEKKAYPDERSYVSSQFIALYMPADGEDLVELY